MKKTYRKDIDGLRAIAVLSVVLFHSGYTFISGGYVGVDVFFVISGFLITTIIHGEIEANNFSIARFYERRIRRIFPALFVVIIFCIVIGFLFYAPDDFRRVAKTARYTVIFYSNYLFASKTGYFDTGAELEPLLHTWSLAVEEQYYIVFPVLLMVVSKYLNKKYLLSLSAIFIVSFVVSFLAVELDSHRAFFATEVRTWELLLGSLVALNVFPIVCSKGVKNWLSIMGLVFILLSIFMFDESTAFPGLAALLPTVGAALILYAGTQGVEGQLVGKILSFKPFVFVGVISYSLYMWHWPLIVFTKHLLIRPMQPFETLLLLGLMGVVSFLSWKYVEQPFRSPRFFTSQKRLFKVTVSVMFSIFLLCLIIKATDGFSSRSDVEVDGGEIWEKWGSCSKGSKVNVVGGEGCFLGVADEEPSFLLWGDSHARAIANGVSIGASKYDKSGLISSVNGCPPLIGVDVLSVEDCLPFNDKVFEYIKTHPTLNTVILAARWAAQMEGDGYGVEPLEAIKLRDIFSSRGSQQAKDNELVIGDALKRTVNKLLKLNKRVVLVSQVPEVGYNVETVYFVTERTGRNLNETISPSIEEYHTRNKRVKKLFDTLSSDQVVVVNPWELLCDDSECRVINDNKLLYKDDDHLSSYGAMQISPVFDAVFGLDKGVKN